MIQSWTNDRGGTAGVTPPTSSKAGGYKLAVYNSNVDIMTNDKHSELISIINQEKPGIVALCEIKHKRPHMIWNEAQFNITGYNMESRIQDQGRGMIIYLKQHLSYKLLLAEDITEGVQEVQMIELKLEEEKSVVCSVYRSPNSTRENNDKINSLLLKIAENDDFIIVGDFNYPNVDWNTMTNRSTAMDSTYRFTEALKDGYLQQHVTVNTRGRGQATPSILDLVITKANYGQPKLDFGAPLGKSDRCIVKAEFDFKPQENTYSQARLNYRKGNYQQMNEELNINWEDRLAVHTDVDDMWMDFRDAFLTAEKNSIPPCGPTKDCTNTQLHFRRISEIR